MSIAVEKRLQDLEMAIAEQQARIEALEKALKDKGKPRG